MEAKQCYKFGIKFRSKLERKWASLLNIAGLDFIYEQKVFHKDGLGYAPDFYLPKYNLYIEVKPCKPSEKEIEKSKICDTPVLFFCAYPETDHSYVDGVGYYNAFMFTAEYGMLGWHETLSGHYNANYDTHALFNLALDNPPVRIGEVAEPMFRALSEGERATRTTEVKSTAKEDPLLTELISSLAKALNNRRIKASA